MSDAVGASPAVVNLVKPRIHLLVAGTGDEEKRIRSLARERLDR